MQYDSKVVAFTQSPYNPNNKICTWEITIPKWMVAELNTHKVEIERNSASSRAVPTSVIIDMVAEYPCFPIWKYNEKGMSATLDLTEEDARYADAVWLEIRDAVVPLVKKLQKLPSGKSVAKGTANRPLEFIMWTKVVVTMTTGGSIGLNNFFGLRDNEAAQPEFGLVAKMMHEQYHTTKPQVASWHLPYINIEEVQSEGNGYWRYDGHLYEDIPEFFRDLAIRSSAICGRVTHYRQGQKYTLEEDLARGNSFADSGHFSPLRHASTARLDGWYGNFYGWEQISKILMDGKDYATKCCNLADIPYSY